MDSDLDVLPSQSADFRTSPQKETHTVNSLETEAPMSGDSAGPLNSPPSDDFRSPSKRMNKKRDKENDDILSVPCSPASVETVSNDMNISPRKSNKTISPQKRSVNISSKKSDMNISPQKSNMTISPKKNSMSSSPEKNDMNISPRKQDLVIKIEPTSSTREDEKPTPEDQLGPGISEPLPLAADALCDGIGSQDLFIEEFSSPVKQKKRKKEVLEESDALSDHAVCLQTFSQRDSHADISPKKKRIQDNSGEDIHMSGQELNSETVEESPLNEFHESSKKHKKSKKKKKDNQHGEVSGSESVLEPVFSDLHESAKKHKKSKKKKKDNQDDEACDPETVLEPLSNEFTESSKKHKKSKKKKKDKHDGDVLDYETNLESPSTEVGDKQDGGVFDSETYLESPSTEVGVCSKKHKKSKKKKKDHQDGDVFDTETCFESPSTEVGVSSKKHKKSKKKKKDHQDDDVFDTETCLESPSTEVGVSSKKRKKKKKDHQDGDVFDSETCLESPSTQVGVSSKKHKKSKKKKKDHQDGDVFDSETYLESPSTEVGDKQDFDVFDSETNLESPSTEVGKSSQKHKKKKKRDNEDGDVSDSEAVLQSPSHEFQESSKKHKKSKKKKKDNPDDVSDSGAMLESTSTELCESSKKHKKKKKRDCQNDESSCPAQDDSHLTALDDVESCDNPNVASEKIQQIEVEQEVHDDSSHRGSSEFSIHTDSSENALTMEDSHPARSKKRRRETTMQSGDADAMKETSHKKKKDAEKSSTGETTVTVSQARHTEETHEKSTSLDDKYNSEKPCYICKEGMESKKKYIQHLAKTHEKHSYQCPRCSRPLSSRTLLKHHMQTCCILKYSSEFMITPYRCQLCPMVYAYKFNLQRHLRTEHDIGKPTEIHCAHCDQPFTSVARAKQHEAKCIEGLAKKAEQGQDIRMPFLQQTVCIRIKSQPSYSYNSSASYI